MAGNVERHIFDRPRVKPIRYQMEVRRNLDNNRDNIKIDAVVSVVMLLGTRSVKPVPQARKSRDVVTMCPKEISRVMGILILHTTRTVTVQHRPQANGREFDVEGVHNLY